MTARREAQVFGVGVALVWALFCVLAYLSPVELDDWYQLAWHRTHPFGIASVWEYAHYNYYNFNPRLGDTLLLLVNGPRWIHLVVTPVVELGLVALGFALAFARWPRPTLRDLQLLAVLQALIWLIVPIPGVMYVYRPFCTNYVYAFAIVLALFVPYRFALARPTGQARAWLVVPMVVLGWLAGMSNEHTGPTQLAAMLAIVFAAWRTRRLRAWMLAGAVGLFVGYPMLFFAPGQAVRYGGLATQQSPLTQLADRGVDGNFQIILDFVGEAASAIEIAALAYALVCCAAWARGERAPGLGRAPTLVVAVLVAAAGAIVVTLFASPVVGERLFFAPGVLLAGALLIVVDRAFELRHARRLVVGLAAAVLVWHAVRLLQVYVRVKVDNDARRAELSGATPGTVPVIPAYREWRRSRWHLGDDFQYASLREFVGNEVYDLRGIELESHERWAEPTAPGHFTLTRTFEPPFVDADRVAPPPYIPSYWEWAYSQLRKQLGLHGLGDVDGHRLVHYVVDDVNLAFTDPLHRPLHVLDWTPERTRFVEGRPFDDDDGTPFVKVWPSTAPPHWTESYIVGCGHTRKVTLRRDARGVMIPVVFECRGMSEAIACEPDQCWLAGRYYR